VPNYITDDDICPKCNGNGFIYENETGDLPISKFGSSRMFNIKAWVCPLCAGRGSIENIKEEESEMTETETEQVINNNNVVNFQTNINNNTEDINMSNEEVVDVDEANEELEPTATIDIDDVPGTCKTCNITISCEDTGTGFKITKNVWAEAKPTHPLAIMISHLNHMVEDVLNNSGMKPLPPDAQDIQNTPVIGD